jgi:GDP-L-fucose synthase
MKGVIITGATGFIGRALCAEIARRFGPDCLIVPLSTREVDLTDRAATFDWFTRTRRAGPCDHIIHLAALYKAGDWPVHHPATQFHANMAINVNLLEAWRRFLPTAKLTAILSYCMYPSHEAPHPESELWGTEPEDYLFAYAFTKKALLIGQRAYRQEYGLNSTSVVLPTVYGPGDSFAENSHVMGALVGKFVRAACDRSSSVEVWGDGLQEREFLYVDDAIDGIIAAVARSDEVVLNLGTGQAYAIGDIANWIGEAASFRGKITYNNNRFVGVRRRLLDVSRVKEVLGWQAATPIETGIRQTVAWYKATLPENQTAV